MSLQILCVDDDLIILSAYRRSLRRLGDITVASSVPEARECLRAASFDVVVSDMMIPPSTGAALHKWAKGEGMAVADRFIFCSGGMDDDLMTYVRASGCPLLLKPAFNSEMVDLIQKVASRT